MVDRYCSLVWLLKRKREWDAQRGVEFHYPCRVSAPQQYFSICRCRGSEWNPQMSQIGLLQLCGGLALSVLVQGHWNRFQLAGPPWIETTHALQSCRKREKHLKFYWSPVQSVPSTPSSMTGPSPLTSPHFVFLSPSLPFCCSSPISSYLTPPSLCLPCLLLHFIPALPQILPTSHVWKTWFQICQRKYDSTLIGQQCTWKDEFLLALNITKIYLMGTVLFNIPSIGAQSYR